MNAAHRTTTLANWRGHKAMRLTRGFLAAVFTATIVLAPGSAGRTAARQNPLLRRQPTVAPAQIVETPPLSRLLDTRASAPLEADSSTVIVTGQPGANAVGVNLTIDHSAGPGFLTVWADGPRPETSVLNADESNATVANYIVVPVTPDGTFLLYTSVATDVIVDLMTRFNASDSIAAPGPGEDGPQGDAGPQGDPGPTGPAGPVGETGAIGPQGDPGPVGPAGPIGAIGPAGPIGATGATGPQGDPGPIGPAGPIGATGAIGPAGPIGATGAIGPAGPIGATGAIGPAGPIGATGAIGPQGVAGSPGATVLATAPGLYVDNTLGSTGTGVRALANNRIELVPFSTAVPLTIDLAGISVSTGAAGDARVVVYSSSPAGWPNQLLLQTANLSTATVAFVSAPLAFTFQPGTRYWVGVHSASTAAIRALPLSSAMPLGLITPTGTTYASVIRRTITFGSPPATWAFVLSDLVAGITPPSIRFRAA